MQFRGICLFSLLLGACASTPEAPKDTSALAQCAEDPAFMASCAADCLRRRQMEAVSADVLQRQCHQDCGSMAGLTAVRSGEALKAQGHGKVYLLAEVKDDHAALSDGTAFSVEPLGQPGPKYLVGQWSPEKQLLIVGLSFPPEPTADCPVKP